MELADLVYAYPDQYDPLIQTKIASKYEFYSLSTTYEGEVKSGELYKHQKLIKRLMLVYDRLLLYHKAGTGKTAAAFGSSEQFKVYNYIGDYVRDYLFPRKSYIKRVVVLTRGKTLIEEIKRQLVYNINPQYYITPEVVSAPDLVTQTRRINQLIREFYDIQTYISFASNIIKSNYTDEQIREIYSNHMFIVDEVQNLNLTDYTSWGDAVDEPELYLEASKNKQDVYWAIHRVFHKADRIKILLLSATPIIDKSDEIKSVMNLILPEDRQMGDDLDLTNPTLAQLEPYFRGLVSYVREYAISDIKIEFQGIPIDQYQTIVYPSSMAEFQYKVYSKVKSSEYHSFRVNERQACNFVYPDGSYGNDGFNKYIIRLAPDVYEARDELGEYLTPAKLAELSAKFYNILALCLNNPGSCFISSEFKKSGAILLAVCFRRWNIEQYLLESAPFLELAETTKIIDPKYPKKPRFAIITPETSSARMQSIIQLFNSYENRHGEYLKILIGSPVIGTGVNLFNVVNIHIVEANWNRSVTYQAFSRAIRGLASHAYLNPPVTIKIYQHASVVDNDTTVDLDLYITSEEKDIVNSKILRIMKQCAIDGYIHYERNVRPTDIDYSAACDYQPCRYELSAPPPETIDFSSYDILYSAEIIDDIILSIRWIFAYRNQLSLAEIINLSTDQLGYTYSNKYYIQALEKIITQRIPIINRYGFICYMYESNDIYYILSDYPLSHHSADDKYYSQYLITINNRELSDYIADISIEQEDQLVEILRYQVNNNLISYNEMESILYNFTITTKTKLVEDAIIRIYITFTADIFDYNIANLYYFYIFAFYEPKGDISAGPKIFRRKRKNKTYRIRKLTKTELSSIEYHPDLTSPIVYVNTMYNQVYDRVGYAVVANTNKAEGRIRIFKDNKWYDASEYEMYLYNQLLQIEINNRLLMYEVYPIYGIYFITKDRKFRIRDKTTEDTDISLVDNRRINRGRDCSTWKKNELVILMHKLDIPPPDIRVEVDLQYIKSVLAQEEFDVNVDYPTLIYYYKWMISPYNRNTLCRYVIERLYELNRVLEI